MTRSLRIGPLVLAALAALGGAASARAPAVPAINADAVFGSPSAFYVRARVAIGKTGPMYLSSDTRIFRSDAARATNENGVYTVSADGTQWDVVTAAKAPAVATVVLTRELSSDGKQVKWHAFARIEPRPSSGGAPQVMRKAQIAGGLVTTQ